ncbi:DNA recombination protein RmuC [Pseudaestuariivita atlantica]|uniref:DNA recombination protein RmuC homolog n=1 Tax=Pseudaestuariivita atlantica TaxID=1317121 RepID=A0A0L1JSI5_9RHOB|nr:DNA recombination protein RmuC [Pseudaestuariivita atlantica]KNG94720.1 recombinase RmuC [Pseudaestuariivita atlantica]
MIQLGDLQIALDDPVVLALGAVALVVLILLWSSARAASRAARASEPLAQSVAALNARVQALGDGQQQLAGGLTHVSEAQAASQTQVLRLMEARLADVNAQMAEALGGASRRTAQSLGELQERLTAIDRAQANITKLSGDVLSLQDILSNKQTRGAFGEIQLHDIVAKALPKDSYTWQATLTTGARADLLIHLPQPPGPIVVDAKFPLDAYEAIRRSGTNAELNAAIAQMKRDLRKHIRDIADKYVLPGETADGALLFLPSEAVYAELHANFADVVREGFAARVWIVSPTTCMAVLNTMRAVLKDARMREQAGAIRRELGLLNDDVTRLGARVDNLDRHFGQAAKDLSEIRVSADKASRRARRLDTFEFEEDERPPLARPAE